MCWVRDKKVDNIYKCVIEPLLLKLGSEGGPVPSVYLPVGRKQAWAATNATRYIIEGKGFDAMYKFDPLPILFNSTPNPAVWAGGFGLPGPKAGLWAARCRCEVRPPAPAAREPASQFIPVPQVGLCHECNIKRLTDLESASHCRRNWISLHLMLRRSTSSEHIPNHVILAIVCEQGWDNVVDNWIQDPTWLVEWLGIVTIAWLLV